MDSRWKTNRGSVYNLGYHIIWCPKYRRKKLVGDIERRLRELLYEKASQNNWEIKELEIMPDHVHLLVSCKPQVRLSDLIKILKGNTARWLFLKHPEIKKQLWGGHLWNPSYFVVTVSDRSLEQVAQYINNQKTK